MESSARMRCFGGYVPMKDIEIVDTEQKIWKGTPVMQVGMREEPSHTIYFSRDSQPDINDLDKVYPEYHVHDASLLGFEFWLIPKEKLLFGYEPTPGGGIILPKLKIAARPGGM